jgi:hypothetical protein
MLSYERFISSYPFSSIAMLFLILFFVLKIINLKFKKKKKIINFKRNFKNLEVILKFLRDISSPKSFFALDAGMLPTLMVVATHVKNLRVKLNACGVDWINTLHQPCC